MAMSIGVDPELSTSCSDILGLAVVRVPDLASAAEKLALLRPLVVITTNLLKASDLESLRARCLDISSEVVVLPPRRSLELELKGALRAAQIQRGG
jgi:hypothetical protein